MTLTKKQTRLHIAKNYYRKTNNIEGVKNKKVYIRKM